MSITFDNSYARLPAHFSAAVVPTTVRAPKLIRLNIALAEQLGLDVAELGSPDGVLVLSGNKVPAGANPLAMAYAGHQFGGFVPQLGDGRAILLGEVVTSQGQRFDIQLKGSGPTPFSRQGDGRAAMGPVLREYIVAEAMAALGVPTTRALAAVATGEAVFREEALPGAVLTRVAASHLRVGTFEYFAARDDHEGLATLTRYALERHYPDASKADNAALGLLKCVTHAQARLIAKWLSVGFVHGVMNTDNMTISGETIDYGPCAFLDEYDPNKKFSSIDVQGRYAFGNQPRIAQWNLARLAESLLPLIDRSSETAIRLATEELERFPLLFGEAYAEAMRSKLGLVEAEDSDLALIADLLTRMASGHVDFTLLFRGLCDTATDSSMDADVSKLFAEPESFLAWAQGWRTRLAQEGRTPNAMRETMRRSNPAFIPRNHRIEQAIQAAVQHGDFGPFETLVRVLERPYEDQPEFSHLAVPPQPSERVLRTFCGT